MSAPGGVEELQRQVLARVAAGRLTVGQGLVFLLQHPAIHQIAATAEQQQHGRLARTPSAASSNGSIGRIAYAKLRIALAAQFALAEEMGRSQGGLDATTAATAAATARFAMDESLEAALFVALGGQEAAWSPVLLHMAARLLRMMAGDPFTRSVRQQVVANLRFQLSLRPPLDWLPMLAEMPRSADVRSVPLWPSSG